MITKHKIPCSCCGKIVERFIYCSGGCRVKGYRGKNKLVVEKPTSLKKSVPKLSPPTISPVTESSPKFSDTKKDGYHFVAVMNKWVKD